MTQVLESQIKDLAIDKSSWTPVKFGDVAFEPKESVKDAIKEGIEHVVGLEHIEQEDIHLRRFNSIEESTTFTKKFSPGDVLFGRRRAYLKKAAQAEFTGICSGDITVMRAKESLLPELLPFIVNNEKFFYWAITHSAGGLSPRCKFKDLANYEFLLPPKESQAEIADLLWAMDGVIQKEMKVIKNMKVTRETLFLNLVANSTGIEKKLSDLLIPKKTKSQVPHQRGRYIGLEHIHSGTYTCDEFGASSEVLAQCNLVDRGDLCYSKLRPYLDKAFIATFDAVSTTELLVYDSMEVSKDYLLHHIHSKPFIDYVSGKGFGTKMPRVSHKIIGDYLLKVIDDEESVLSAMKIIMHSEKKAGEKAASSRMLQKALINQVF